MNNTFNIVIPIRLHSSRLEKKALIKLGDLTIIERVVLQALKSNAQNIIVATDSLEIQNVLTQYEPQISVELTNSEHQSGTDRVVEIVKKKKWPLSSIVVNVQGDEPFICPDNINKVAQLLINNKSSEYSTLYAKSSSVEDFFDKNIVKVVTTEQNRALFFFKSPHSYA